MTKDTNVVASVLAKTRIDGLTLVINISYILEVFSVATSKAI